MFFSTNDRRPASARLRDSNRAPVVAASIGAGVYRRIAHPANKQIETSGTNRFQIAFKSVSPNSGGLQVEPAPCKFRRRWPANDLRIPRRVPASVLDGR